MAVVCPKCQYERKPADTAPDYECPRCGIVYSKYDPQRQSQLLALRSRQQAAQAVRSNEPQQASAAAIQPPYSPPPPSATPKLPPSSVAEPSQGVQIPANTAVCRSCEEIGQVTQKMPGSGWVEFVLYLFWIAPGIVYSVWRRKGKFQACSACGSKEVVAARTKAAQRIISDQFENYRITAAQHENPVSEPRPWKLLGSLVGFLAVLFFIQGLVLLVAVDGLAMLGMMSLLLAIAAAAWAFRMFNPKPVTIKTDESKLICWEP